MQCLKPCAQPWPVLIDELMLCEWSHGSLDVGVSLWMRPSAKACGTLSESTINRLSFDVCVTTCHHHILLPASVVFRCSGIKTRPRRIQVHLRRKALAKQGPWGILGSPRFSGPRFEGKAGKFLKRTRPVHIESTHSD